LLDEWSALYPYLSPRLDLLRRHGHYFRLGDVTIDELETLCLQCVDGDEFKLGKDSELLESFYRGKVSPLRLRVSIAHMLYSVGAAGLKTGLQDFLRWSYQGSSDIPLSDITDDTRIHVHKMLWRTLGLVEIENDHD